MGLLQEEGKRLPIDACFFCYIHSFLAFTSFFLFSLISFSILSVSCLSPYLPFICGYCSYLYWVSPIWFLSFALVAYQPFLSAVYTFSELPTTLLAVWPLLHLGMPSVFFSLPLPILWQILIHLIPHLKKFEGSSCIFLRSYL